MANLILVTGGQRSGKSVEAEKIALQLSDSPLYVATARVLDSEMERRVEAHRARRDSRWLSVEEPLRLASIPWCGRRVALIDCVTLWATNAFFEFGEDVSQALSFLENELEAILASAPSDSTIIMVTNEVGLGGISADPIQRHFADLQGRINTIIAAKARKVIMTISGIPLTIKDETV